MDLFGFLGLFGGVALFLYGMSLLGGSLAGVSRDWLPGLLNRLAGSPLRGRSEERRVGKECRL